LNPLERGATENQKCSNHCQFVNFINDFLDCFEILFFAQKPNFFTWIGVALVFSSLVAIGIVKLNESKRNSELSSPTAKKGNNEEDTLLDDENRGDDVRNEAVVSQHIDEESQELVQVSTKDD